MELRGRPGVNLMTIVTQSQSPQAQEAVSVRSLKEVGFGYLSSVPAEWAFWGLMAFLLVGVIVGLVVTVKTVRAVKRSVKRYAAKMSAALKEQASADSNALRVLDRMRQLTFQKWRGWYAKVHLGLCLLVSGAGIALAAEQHASMPFPTNLLAFVAFEGLAVAVMMRIEDRAQRALPYPGLIIMYWATIGAATAVQTTHIDNLVGKVIWAAFTLSGGLVYHLFISSVRSDKEARLRDWEARWFKRRMELVRWLRPVEAIQVVWEKAADADLGTDEATRRVRERASRRRGDYLLNQVMWSVWRLRRAQQMRGFQCIKAWFENNHLTRTQMAIARAQLHADPVALEDLLRRLEAMDLAPKLARMRSRSDARLIFGTYSGSGSAVGSVGSLTQFALPSAEPRGGFDGPDPSGSDSDSGSGVQVVFVSGPDSGSAPGFDGQGSGGGEFVPAAHGAVPQDPGSGQGFTPKGSQFEEGFIPQGSPAHLAGSEFDGSDSVAATGVDQQDTKEPEPEPEPELFEEGSSERERGLWEHSADGWIPPAPDQAWAAAADESWPETLFDATPKRRVPTVVGPEPEVDNVRTVRTMDQLRQELVRAWAAREITALSSQQIYKALSISKKRAAELRDWLLREELRSELESGDWMAVTADVLIAKFGITRKQANELLRWAVDEGLAVMDSGRSAQ